MILARRIPELKAYENREKALPFALVPSLEAVAVPAVNDNLPVHRWFRLKEAFSANLLREIIESIPELGKRKQLHLLDPFSGVGTGLLASQEMSAMGFKITGTGLEINPFLAFAGRTKTRWPEIDPKRLLELGEEVLSDSTRFPSKIPRLSSLTSGRCLSRHMSRRIVALRNVIQSHGHNATCHALLLGLAASIEPVSRIRKDGRALRIVQKCRTILLPTLVDQWHRMARDVEFLQDTLPGAPVPLVVQGDGRIPSKYGVEANSIDLILTSPPYPNNIDYSEVYKLELWLMGFVSTATEFLRLRHSTFRSHPTIEVPYPSQDFMDELRKGSLKSLLNSLLRRARKSQKKWRQRLLIGYFSDMWEALREHYRCLRRNGYEVLVIGNSLHGGADDPYLIPTDIIVGTMAERLGFSVERILVTRSMKRRLSGNHFLRESIVVLKKTNA